MSWTSTRSGGVRAEIGGEGGKVDRPDPGAQQLEHERPAAAEHPGVDVLAAHSVEPGPFGFGRCDERRLRSAPRRSSGTSSRSLRRCRTPLPGTAGRASGSGERTGRACGIGRERRAASPSGLRGRPGGPRGERRQASRCRPPRRSCRSRVFPSSRLKAGRRLSPHSVPTSVQTDSSVARRSGSQRDPQVNRCHSIPDGRADRTVGPYVEPVEGTATDRAGSSYPSRKRADRGLETRRPLGVRQAVAPTAEQASEAFRAQAALPGPGPRRGEHRVGELERRGVGHGGATEAVH